MKIFIYRNLYNISVINKYIYYFRPKNIKFYNQKRLYLINKKILLNLEISKNPTYTIVFGATEIMNIKKEIMF